MKPNFKTKRNNILKKTIVLSVAFILFFTIIMPTINSQFIKINSEKLENYLQSLNPLCEYTLTLIIEGNGTVNKNPNQTQYPPGTIVQLTAIPDIGWMFSHWSGDLTGNTNPTTITMNSNKIVYANFSQNEYTLTITIVGSGTVNKNPNQSTYHYGDIVTLTAIANTGWGFSGWSGDLTGSTNPTTITINGNKSVTATFTQNEYILTIVIEGSGIVNKNPDQTTYQYGTVVTLTAVPSNGWSFNHWSGDLTGNNNPENITMNDNKTIIANFTINYYTLTINIQGNGTVNKNPNQTTYPYGTIVTLTAIPETGWTFDHWSGDLTGNNNPENITMNSNKTIIANFTTNQYTLTINIEGNGTVNKNPNQTTYPYGTIVTLTAIPETGWVFSNWSGDLTSNNNPENITMNNNKTVTATFTQNQYTLTINIQGNGTVNKNPNQTTYPYGTIVTLTAIPETGWTFDHWSGDLSGNTNPNNITINDNKTVIANFTTNQYTLTINIEGNGTVNKNPNQTTYSYGTAVELTAIPDNGWMFSHWSGDLTGGNNPENIIIDDNKTVTAHFSINEYILIINIYGDGEVIKSPDYATYPYGTIVELTAVPDTGWGFDHWSGDITGNENPKEILINGHKIVNAHFIEDSISPILEIKKPNNGIYLLDWKVAPFIYPVVINEVTILANASDNESGIERVEFYIDGNLRKTDESPPYNYLWNDNLTKEHKIEVKAYDYAGNSAIKEIDVIKFNVKHPLLILGILMAIYLVYLIRNN